MFIINAITTGIASLMFHLGGASTILMVNEAMQNPVINAGSKLILGAGRISYGVSETTVTEPMKKLINLIMWVFQGLGFILIGFGIFNFVSNMDGHDNSQKIRAGLTVGGGILLASIKGIVKLLGIEGSDSYLG